MANANLPGQHGVLKRISNIRCCAFLEGSGIPDWDGSCSVANADAGTGNIFLRLPVSVSSDQLQAAAQARQLRVRLPTMQSSRQCCKYTIKHWQLGREEESQERYKHLDKEQLLFDSLQFRCKLSGQPSGPVFHLSAQLLIADGTVNYAAATIPQIDGPGRSGSRYQIRKCCITCKIRKQRNSRD